RNAQEHSLRVKNRRATTSLEVVDLRGEVVFRRPARRGDDTSLIYFRGQSLAISNQDNSFAVLRWGGSDGYNRTVSCIGPQPQKRMIVEFAGPLGNLPSHQLRAIKYVPRSKHQNTASINRVVEDKVTCRT